MLSWKEILSRDASASTGSKERKWAQNSFLCVGEEEREETNSRKWAHVQSSCEELALEWVRCLDRKNDVYTKNPLHF